MNIVSMIADLWGNMKGLMKILSDIAKKLERISNQIDDVAAGMIRQSLALEKISGQLDRMEGQLGRIEAAVTVEQAVSFTVVVGEPEDQETGEVRKGAHMTFDHITIKDSERVRVTVDPASIVDKKGNPAKIDGTPTFESSDPAIATFVPDPDVADGFTGLLTAVGSLTDATALSVTVDADLGAGVTPLVVNGLVEITAGAAVSFGVTVGTPEEQP